MMYGRGKSNSAIVAAKLVNKTGRLAAESVGARGRGQGEGGMNGPGFVQRPFGLSHAAMAGCSNMV